MTTTEHAPVRAVEILPVSAAQRRFWLIEQMDGADGVYNSAAALRLRGRLDHDALENAFQVLVDRHESLRTVFPARGGVPVQLILPRRRFELERIDARGRTPEERAAWALDRAATAASRRFDLAKGPLMRAELIAVGPDDHMLVVALQHIVVDRWSFGLLMDELSQAYAARLEGRTPVFAPMPVRYPDHVAQRQAVLDGPYGEQLLRHWTARMAGAPQALGLPTDRQRPAVRSFRGATVPVAFGTALSDRVREYSRRSGATPFMVVLAGLQAVLARCSGDTDVVVLTGPATRPPGTERLVGCLVNTVLLRTSLTGEPSFETLIDRVREATLDAFEHRELPFDRLVEALAPERDLSRNPLSQVGFVLQNAPATVPALTGLDVEAVRVARRDAHLDLDFQLTEENGEFIGFVEYATDLFDAETVDRLAGHWTTLLTAALAAPRTSVFELPILDAEATRLALEEWNPLPDEAPGDSCLHELVAAQVARTPEAPAVIDGTGRETSYRELWTWAGRIAAALRGHGVGPDVPVGICVRRGAALPAGMLGALRAGGAFLALDPDYPPGRLADMLADARPAVTLVERATARLLPGDANVVVVEDLDPEGAEFSGATGVLPAHLAYLVFTSGSTGRPKCVGVPHQGILNTFAGLERVLGYGPGDRMSGMFSPSFDPAVFDCLAPLLVGAATVTPEHEFARDPHHWVDLVERHRITWWHMTPSGAEALLTAALGDGRRLDSLRVVQCGGDVMPPSLHRMVALAAPGAALINAGGVAEASICSNLHRVTGPVTGRVPYGTPLANQQLLVLDDKLRLVPPGVVGELCLAGGSLARGYLGRPGQTADRYRPHPYRAGERIYRTGDLARWRADGVVELLGRVDRQVKIRGFRVEPDEVAFALLGHPDVADAVVAARPDPVAGQRLVAWWVGRRPLNPGELAACLAERLPGHMVPSAWAELAELPLTANGKVDYDALPEPVLGTAAGAVPAMAPRTPLEAAVAGIWQQLLGLPVDDVHSDFFALGGHSLLANRLVVALRAEFGIELRLSDLFGAVTVAAQADLVQRLRTREPESVPPPIRPVAGESELPLSFAQQRMWIFDLMAPGSPAYNVPAAVRISGPLDEKALAEAVRGILERHEVLRTAVSSREGVPAQRVMPVPEHPLTVTGPVAEEEVAERVRAFAVRPFALADEAPFRAELLRLAPRDHVLLLNVHHIAMDGWSMAVLVDDLGTLYDGGSLPALPVRYRDFAAWQTSEELQPFWERQLDHWRDRLSGSLPVLELPADRARPAVPSLAGGTHEFRLPAALTAALRRLSAERGATLFMTLLAGYQTLLARLTGAADVIVGTPVAGRTRPELDGVVGCFVNTLALRGDLSGDPAFAELLRRTKERTLADFDHQDVPLDRVLDSVGAERDPARHPLFQTMLTLQSAPLPDTGFEGLDVTPLGSGTDTCLMDLMFTAVESDDTLDFTVEYATDLFDAAGVAQLAARFVLLLEAAVADPQTAIGSLPLMDTDERRTLLQEWNATAREIPQATIAQLIAERAALTPDAPALECQGRVLSYAELERRASRCATALQDRGVGREAVVAVDAGATEDLVVALLGVLKAGAAFLTLDPAHPTARVEQVLETAAPALVLTGQGGRGEGDPAFSGRATVPVATAQEEGPARTAASVHPSGLACVFFTSGTTGRPKGVMFDQRSLVNLALAMREKLGLDQGDRFLQLAPVGFDVLLEEVLPVLAAGATLVLPGSRILAEGVDLGGYLDRHRITALELTTAYWHEWVEQLVREDGRPPASLRVVAMGGERVRADRLADWQQWGVPLVHVYGITEAGCTSTTEPVRAEPVTTALPIGRPLPNTRCYLLDRSGRPVPPGVPGELHLGGAGLARGYIGRPGATSARFLPDHLSGIPGARLYRTGDLARQDRRGRLEFLGRVDQQVKIRGHRIEPGEAETRLTAQPSVGHAVVLVREDRPGEKRLVGYVTPAADGVAPDGAALRAALREELPGYLVPEVLVVLPQLPLNANGKLDRAALPAPTRAELAGGGEAVAPRTPLEQSIADLVGELLGLDAVGVHDNLFDLGLHSLLAARFAARAREELGTELPLRVFYEEPTVAGLALCIVQEQAELAGLEDLDDLDELLAELETETS
ncbi:amino acid adenylation domain-containing protein [Peterkaempfera sp. SMS 1(5)a]|uniref:amino acid adenylation domain-containing protein n=1 Tax=Peterkaempfera podocarpi TaxID=3232308 RepID=UPI00366DFFE0